MRTLSHIKLPSTDRKGDIFLIKNEGTIEIIVLQRDLEVHEEMSRRRPAGLSKILSPPLDVYSKFHLI